MRFEFKLKPSPAGFTLVEVTIAAALASVSILAASSIITMSESGARKGSAMATRDEIIMRLRRMTLNEAALRATATALNPDGSQVNPEFSKCLSAGDWSDYSRCTHSQAFPLTLYDNFGTTDPPVGGPLGYTNGNPFPEADAPQYYDTSGRPCTSAAGPRCLIKVLTGFRGYCAPFFLLNDDPTHCPVAEAIEFMYVVQTFSDSATREYPNTTLSGSFFFSLVDATQDYGNL